MVVEGLSGTYKGLNFNFDEFVMKPMSVVGAAGVSVRHYVDTLSLMETGKITAKPIITHTLPLQNILEGFELLKSKKEGVIKVVLNP